MFFAIQSSLPASSLGCSGGGAGKGQLATTSLEFEHLHWKSRCEVLIGGNDISNEVITLGTCFSRFAYIRSLVSASRWLAEIWQLSWRGSTGKLEVEFKFQRRGCKLSFLFPPRFQSTTESLLPVHIQSGWWMGNLEENGKYYASVQTSSWKWAYEKKKRKEKKNNFLFFSFKRIY